MMIAIANQRKSPMRSHIACGLAVLRARSGRKVCVVDTDGRRVGSAWCAARRGAGLAPAIAGRCAGRSDLGGELGRLSRQFHDILVDAGERDGAASRAVLAAASLVLATVQPEELDWASQYALIARLGAARAVNPRLRTQLVLLCDEAPALREWQALQAYAARLPGSVLAPAWLSLPAERDYGAGRCVCDAQACDPETAAQLVALYRAVYLPPADGRCAAG